MSVVDLSYINLLDLGKSIHLVGMILERDLETFLLLLPEYDVKDDIKNMSLSHEDWKEIIKQLDFKETEILADDNGKIKRTIIRKCTRQIENGISWRVYRRDNYTCRYCGRNDVPLTVDHLVLWENGGPSIEENLVTACRRCNNKRGNMLYDDWMKSYDYKKLSRNLSEDIKRQNIDLILMLNTISVRLHKRKR